VRRIKKLQSMRYIALSGFGMEEDVAKSSAAGFSIHLTKPVDVRQLESSIERLVEKS
ncbi:MAG: hypothetical protein QOD99_2011, partial [Chthoniobacter sp.]|nr:hypothetical protein [Chthoniobacter sp.]